MIQQLCSKHWCAVPLLFLSQALSELPPSPLVGIAGLTALRYLIMVTVRQTVSELVTLDMAAHLSAVCYREVLRCTMITHQVLLRGAAQCFLLNTALRLTEVVRHR